MTTHLNDNVSDIIYIMALTAFVYKKKINKSCNSEIHIKSGKEERRE